MPLPPYIRREKDEPDTARIASGIRRCMRAERGVGGGADGGAALYAGDAGGARARGVEIATVTLHVGLGTFQPVRVERTEEIRLHAERIRFRRRRQRRSTGRGGGPAHHRGGHDDDANAGAYGARGRDARRRLEAHSGTTSIFLSPGPEFKVVGGLLTNFHLPQSTLLMLVRRLRGRERVLAAYAHAVEAAVPVLQLWRLHADSCMARAWTLVAARSSSREVDSMRWPYHRRHMTESKNTPTSRRFICSTRWRLFFARTTRCSGRGRCRRGRGYRRRRRMCS